MNKNEGMQKQRINFTKQGLIEEFLYLKNIGKEVLFFVSDSNYSFKGNELVNIYNAQSLPGVHRLHAALIQMQDLLYSPCFPYVILAWRRYSKASNCIWLSVPESTDEIKKLIRRQKILPLKED